MTVAGLVAFKTKPEVLDAYVQRVKGMVGLGSGPRYSSV